MKISKTSRILSLYHLFLYCEEVSYKEVTDLMPISKKTIYRDICLLKQAGIIQPQHSKKHGAFILSHEKTPQPQLEVNKSQRLYLEKLIRLCRMMSEMDDGGDPVAWYREHFPNLTDRTRQRDFAELGKIGYRIIYQRCDDGDEEHPVGNSYCDFPYSTYSLETFI